MNGRRLATLAFQATSVQILNHRTLSGSLCPILRHWYGTATMPPRRSTRLQALKSSSSLDEAGEKENQVEVPVDLPNKRKRRSIPKRKSDDNPKTTKSINCLPRTIEMSRLSSISHVKYVFGIDEAGRGPLAGPVVAAAVWAPSDLDGIIDSKKITKEEERERLFEELMKMDHLQWAVSIMDAKRIDEINILQATLEGMRLAATMLVNPTALEIPVHPEISVDILGCYIVSSTGFNNVENSDPEKSPFHALIDGNKVPKDMPCDAESVVKGDGKEFCIAAASILAKVTRDRLMHAYDLLYPHYNLKQHKGYPTKDHMAAVFAHGASPIHRRTFAPLKHMEFDADGKVVKEK